MDSVRSYHQHCGLARALDRVGERWTLLMVRELLLGPRSYAQFLESLPGLTTNLLARRLKRMQEVGLIVRSGRGPGTRYRLTEMGLALEPAVMALAAWGGRFMQEGLAEDRRDLGWALLSFKRRYRGGETLRVGLESQGREFELAFLPEGLQVQERRALAPDLLLRGTREDFFGMLFEARLEPEMVVQAREGALPRLLAILEGTAP